VSSLSVRLLTLDLESGALPCFCDARACLQRGVSRAFRFERGSRLHEGRIPEPIELEAFIVTGKGHQLLLQSPAPQDLSLHRFRFLLGRVALSQYDSRRNRIVERHCGQMRRHAARVVGGHVCDLIAGCSQRSRPGASKSVSRRCGQLRTFC
jgi:hypothetical protein